MSIERVIILGGSGFLGQNLAAHLESTGVAALPLSSLDVNLAWPGCLAGLEQRVRPGDAVVFAAALTPDRGKDLRTFASNLRMAEHVAHFLDRAGCAQLIYISSDAVYADGVTPIREATPAQPGGLYGHMHLVREHMLNHVASANGFPYLVLRPCALYGALDTHNSYGPNRFMRSAQKDGVIGLFGGGEELRDHLLVDDFSRFIAACLRQQQTGLLNVAPGAAVSFHEVAERIAGLNSRPACVKPTPRQMPITHRHFDVTERIRAFPTFTFTPLDEGLARTWRELNAEKQLIRSA